MDVRVVGPHALHVEFDDGTARTIDFRDVLAGKLFEPLRDPEFFKQVRLDAEFHTVVWPNVADFEPATLHDWPEYEREWVARVRQMARVAEGGERYGDV